MHGVDVYRTYLAFKQHFSNENFDFFKYEGKVKAKEETYQQRSDFYFFETLARKLTDQEVKEYMLASYVSAEDPSKVWIGDIKRSGRNCWLAWKKQQSSMRYTFEQDIESMVNFLEEKGHSFNHLFETLGGYHHPPLFKLFINRRVSLETLIILDIVLGYISEWDKQLKDPLWDRISFKIRKYKPFLSINKSKYLDIMKQKFRG